MAHSRGKYRLLPFAFAFLCGGPAVAQDFEALLRVQPFRIIVGSASGGSYDIYSRLLSRHMGRHLPASPTVIVQNMPGGGGYLAANYIYNTAPKDGSTIATFSRSALMQPLVDRTGVQFDPQKLEWIGSPSDEVGVALSSAASGVKTVADMRQKGLLVAATGPGTDSNVYARVIGRALGADIRLVTGYTGSQDMLLAVERGEAGGIGGVSWSSVWPGKRNLIESKTIIPILQYGRASQHEHLKGVPVITDLVANPEDRKTLEIITARQIIAFPFAAPPDVAPDRLKAVRSAFDRTMNDPQFLADAEAAGHNINPVNAAEMTSIIKRVFASTPEEIARVKRMMGMDGP